ncbi:Rap1a/Tai family immunity protein [Falsiroseomonas sp. HW251]|uniref:Rap1a/Tai family immunity protein n=1 Tax=Falsiroseomonas sp. HW251 TaxID=3390998 RepID=UPI003D3194F7
MKRTIGLAAAALVLAAGAAQAQPAPATSMLTTATLAELCGAAPQTSEAPATAFCRGFIVGAGQYHHASVRPNQRPLFCLPTPGPSQAEFQTAFAAWARANPQFGSERAVDGLARFVSTTYPCPPAQPARARTTR